MIRIEMNRGKGWEVRQEGAATVTVEQIQAALPAYCIQYPHRAFIDGVLVAECPALPQD